MSTHDLTARIQSALEQFDRDRRHKFWKNWHKHPSADRAIFYNNQLYPIKNVMGILNRDYDYQSTSSLVELLNNSGYTVVQLKHKSSGAPKNGGIHKQSLPTFGVFSDEKDFCDKFVIPLCYKIGYTVKKEYPCYFPTGRKTYHGRIDLMVFYNGTAITLVETKHSIQSQIPRTEQTEQARSYALHYGLGTFIIASPEGLWLYKLNRNKEILLRQYKPNGEAVMEAELPQLIHENK